VNKLITQCDYLKLAAVKEAVQVGIADIEAGRFVTFDTVEALERHLGALADEILGDESVLPDLETKP
jgi:predicted transcriptional regulator